jgi:AcrR family transcriptional regulator
LIDSQGRAPERAKRAGDPPERKRDALVSAAYRVIAERGFEGLRTREVAGAVSANIATLHYYFPTKEDLIKGVVGHAVSRFQSTMATEGTAIERLSAHFQGLRRLARDEPELFSVMGELMLRSSRDASLARIIAKMNEYWQGMLRDLLRAARADGDLAAALEPDGMAAVVVATLKGVYLVPAGAPGPSEDFEKAIRQLERIVGLPATKRAATRTKTTRR